MYNLEADFDRWAAIYIRDKVELKLLWHFTDAENLPHIKDAGGILSSRELGRRGIRPPRRGGDRRSRKLDRKRDLDQYVHLSLTKDHPMQYRAEEEGRLNQVVHLCVSSDVLTFEGVRVSLGNPHGANQPLLSVSEWLEVPDWNEVFETLFRGPSPYYLDDPKWDSLRRVTILVPRIIRWPLIKELPEGLLPMDVGKHR